MTVPPTSFTALLVAVLTQEGQERDRAAHVTAGFAALHAIVPVATVMRELLRDSVAVLRARAPAVTGDP